jgi:hypothetical protein
LKRRDLKVTAKAVRRGENVLLIFLAGFAEVAEEGLKE